MARHVTLIDGKPGAFGVVISNCQGCAGMGATIKEALENDIEGPRDWIEAIEAQGGTAPVPRSMQAVPLILH